jgi:hypothetical protein
VTAVGGAVFDFESYRVWHGTAPMADFFRVSDPGMFLVSGTDCTVRDQAGREYPDAVVNVGR